MSPAPTPTNKGPDHSLVSENPKAPSGFRSTRPVYKTPWCLVLNTLVLVPLNSPVDA